MKSWAVPEIWKTQLWQLRRLAPWLRARCMRETRKHPGPPKPIIGQLPANFNFVMKLESLGMQSCNRESTERRGNMSFSTAIHLNTGTQGAGEVLHSCNNSLGCGGKPCLASKSARACAMLLRCSSSHSCETFVQDMNVQAYIVNNSGGPS